MSLSLSGADSGLGLGGDVDLGSMPDWAGALNAGAESEGGTDASALNSLLAGPFGQPSGPDSLGGPDAWTSARDAAQSQQQFVSDRLAQQAADQTGAAGAFSGVDAHDTFFLGGLCSVFSKPGKGVKQLPLFFTKNRRVPGRLLLRFLLRC